MRAVFTSYGCRGSICRARAPLSAGAQSSLNSGAGGFRNKSEALRDRQDARNDRVLRRSTPPISTA